MLTLKESRDEKVITSFTKGAGVSKRIQGGAPHPADEIALIRDKRNVFLVAEEDGVKVGFICLSPHTSNGYAIHVVLRTIGEKTKKLIAMAFNYARHFLNAQTIHAFYPKDARAVEKLCKHFGFQRDTMTETALKSKVPKPYNFQVLVLN